MFPRKYDTASKDISTGDANYPIIIIRKKPRRMKQRQGNWIRKQDDDDHDECLLNHFKITLNLNKWGLAKLLRVKHTKMMKWKNSSTTTTVVVVTATGSTVRNDSDTKMTTTSNGSQTQRYNVWNETFI